MTISAPTAVRAETFQPWPRDTRYRVSDLGTILDPIGEIIPGYVRSDGRRVVSVSGSQKNLVAWMVCETFHGSRPEGAQAAHQNGNCLDDRAANLSWKTPRENAVDRFRHGTMRNKLSGEDVVEIRRRWAAGEKLQVIADDYGVTKQTIWHIGHRKTWKHV